MYDKASDTYNCPQGETFSTTGTWHNKTREKSPYKSKKYRTAKYDECPVRNFCTVRKDGGREIEKSESAEAVGCVF